MHSPTVESALNSMPGAAILFDRAVLPQVSPSLFEPESWGVSGTRARGGRGEVWFVEAEFGAAVLRHYRRGGAVAKLNRDSYLWLGAERTRSFLEFRLLADLCQRGLPVPAPIAARYVRINPLWYRADILMRQVPRAHSLAELFVELQNDTGSLQALGTTLANFHAAGVSHADLNAHNVLRDDQGQWWLIDFDRGRLRSPSGDWVRQKLLRLERSLRKLGGLDSEGGSRAWQCVLQAHREAFDRARQ